MHFTVALLFMSTPWQTTRVLWRSEAWAACQVDKQASSSIQLLPDQLSKASPRWTPRARARLPWMLCESKFVLSLTVPILSNWIISPWACVPEKIREYQIYISQMPVLSFHLAILCLYTTMYCMCISILRAWILWGAQVHLNQGCFTAIIPPLHCLSA